MYLFIYLFIYVFIYLFVYLFIYLFIHSFIHSFIYLVIHSFIYLFIHLQFYHHKTEGIISALFRCSQRRERALPIPSLDISTPTSSTTAWDRNFTGK